MGEPDASLLDRFSDGLWLHDGLARNTLAAYRRDVAQFAAWLRESHGKSLAETDRADLQRHLAWQVESRRAKPRTTGRLVSSLKRFFQFALREGLRADDPAAELDAPRIGRSLPKSISEARSRRCWAHPTSRPRKACAIARCWRRSTRAACACRSWWASRPCR
jgi:integrase/recombinase XerD